MRRPAWHDADEALLLETVEALGSQWEQVAERVGRSSDACRVHYNKQVRSGRWPAADSKRGPTDDQRQAILAGWEHGLTASTLAKKLRLPLTTIEYTIRRGQANGTAHHRAPVIPVSVRPRYSP